MHPYKISRALASLNELWHGISRTTRQSHFFDAYKKGADVIEGVPEELANKLVENLSIAGDLGDLDQRIATLQHYRDLGLDEVALKLHGDQEHAIRVIGSQLLPALQA